MSATSTRFQNEQAPCGRFVDGEHFQDGDEEALVTNHLHYDCGCRSIRHEYHDGNVSRKVIRHDGIVLVDEFVTWQ
jgi:hypothetical protein